MTAFPISEARQRTSATAGAVLGLGVSAGAAVPAHAAVVPMAVAWAGSAALVGARPRGNLPLVPFVVLVVAWAVLVPRPSAWAILGAAGLVAAHVALLVGAATVGPSRVPSVAVAALARRALLVVMLTALAGTGLLLHLDDRGPGRVVAGIVTCSLVTVWLVWPHVVAPRARPRGRVQHVGRHSAPKQQVFGRVRSGRK